MQYVSERRETPITLECNVLAAGGGTGGTIAALAAVRNGAKTDHIERL